MQEQLKLIVAGTVGAGKTTFVANLSEVETVNTDVFASEELGKPQTTVAMDYGILTFDGITLHIYGTPGQDRFDFMWEVLCEGALGLVLLVAGDQPQTFPQARNILDFITSRIDVPFVVGVTREDLPDSWEAEAVADYFGLPESMTVSVNATSTESCLKVVQTILQMVVTE